MAGGGKLQVRHAGRPIVVSSTVTPPAARLKRFLYSGLALLYKVDEYGCKFSAGIGET
jgi:hypothetical protein